nr:DsbA family protein [Haloplanus ruber]
MGNSPTGTSETVDDEEEEQEPSVHPNQTEVEDHDTSEGETTVAPPNDGGGAGGAGAAAGAAAGAGAAPVPTGGETEAPDEDEPEEESEVPEPYESPDPSDSPEPPEDCEHPDDSTDEEEDEEQEQKEAEITVHTDPWDATGWGNEPDLRRLQKIFGGNLTVEYNPLPPRTIDEWDSTIEMPTVDDLDLPESTTESYRALIAAQRQGLAREYLRRLRIAALSDGRDIEDEYILIELAEETGLDTDQLRADMANIDVPEPSGEMPRIEAMIGDLPHSWVGNIESGRIFARMVGENVQPEPTGRSIPQFVMEYEPVATTEVAETFELDRNQAVAELRQSENTVPRDPGVEAFWVTV